MTKSLRPPPGAVDITLVERSTRTTDKDELSVTVYYDVSLPLLYDSKLKMVRCGLLEERCPVFLICV